MITAIFIPSTTELEDAAALARERGFNLYSDGTRSLIARRRPESGTWAKVALRNPIQSAPDNPPCAA